MELTYAWIAWFLCGLLSAVLMFRLCGLVEQKRFHPFEAFAMFLMFVCGPFGGLLMALIAFFDWLQSCDGVPNPFYRNEEQP